MNLLLLGWNLPPEIVDRASRELARMTRVYPQLDPDTLFLHSGDGPGFVASIGVARQVAAPRRYVERSSEGVVLFDGLPIDRDGSFAAHDARELVSRWDDLSACLDGQFVVARLDHDGGRLDLLTDALGVQKLYHYRCGGGWILSSSVSLIDRVAGGTPLDPHGAATFLALRYVAGGHTLNEGIRVVPAGQHWTWSVGEDDPRQETYVSATAIAYESQRPLDGDVSKTFTDRMGTLCRVVGESFEPVACAITGGFDSRALAATLAGSGVKTTLFTSGKAGDADVDVGRRVAQKLSAVHDVLSRDGMQAAGEWDEAARRLVAQNDGLVSLWQVPDVVGQQRPERLDVICLGIGGEIGRSIHYEPGMYLRPRNPAETVELLKRKQVFGGKLLRPAAREAALAQLRRFVDGFVEDGARDADLHDLYCADKASQLFGTFNRKATPECDPFSPFCSRTYLEAVFAVPAVHRYHEPFHRALIRRYAPALESVPFAERGWRAPSPLLNFIGSTASRVAKSLRRRSSSPAAPALGSMERAPLVEVVLPRIRELCLDQSLPLVWEYVDRSGFQRLLSASATAAEREPHAKTILDVATLFTYRSLDR